MVEAQSHSRSFDVEAQGCYQLTRCAGFPFLHQQQNAWTNAFYIIINSHYYVN